MKESIDALKAVTALCAATTSLFADMVFIDAVCTPDSNPERPQVPFDVCVAIDILKPLSCTLELRMPRSLSQQIVDTLGSDEPGADDAVLEMVNILAGVFISEYFGSGATIKLELPMYVYEPPADGDAPIAVVLGDAEGTRFETLIRSVRYRY